MWESARRTRTPRPEERVSVPKTNDTDVTLGTEVVRLARMAVAVHMTAFASQVSADDTRREPLAMQEPTR